VESTATPSVMSIADDPYRLLGVGRSATEQDITTAFRRASLKVHPDRCPNDPNAAAKFGALIKARDLLLSQTKHCVVGNSGGRAACGGGMSWVVTTVPSGNGAPASRNVTSAPRQVQTGWPQASAPGTAWPWASGAGTKKAVASPQKQTFMSSSSRAADIEPTCARARASEPDEEADWEPNKKAQKRGRPGKASREPAKPEKQVKTKAKQTEKKEIPPPSKKGRKTTHKADSPPSSKKETDAGAEDEEEEEEEEDDDEDTHDGEDEEKKPKIEEIYAEDVNEDVDADDDEEDDEDYEPDEPEDDGLEDEDFDFDDAKGAEAPASSPARKRRRLVACSSSSQRKKRAEFPLDGLRAALEDAEHPVEGIPMSARHLLALGCMAVCAEARRTPVDSRQEVTTSALEMIGETLSGLHDTVKRLADEAREVARTAAGDVARKEQLQKAREACSSALRDARSDVSRRSQELGYCKEAIITARGSLRTAVQQAAAAEHKEQDCREDLDKVRGALKTFHALEADGAPAKAGDAKKMIKKVEGQMAKVGVFETLFARVALKIMPALQQNPDNRSSFDDSAISAAEGCFSTYIQEKGDKLEGLERASAGSRDRAHRAKTQIEQAKKKAEAARNAIRQAKEVRTDRGNALRAAIEAQTRHRQEVTDLVSKFKQRGAALADLEDLRQAFEALAAGTQVEPA